MGRMARVTVSAPDELVDKIDAERAQKGAEDGEIPSRSELFREAVCDHLGIDCEEVEEGAA